MEKETNQIVEKPQAPASRRLPLGVSGSESLGKLFEALSKAQGEFTVAVFDEENPHFGNEFASIKSIDAATRAQLTKYGLCVTQIPYSDAGKSKMLTILGHSSGEFLSGDLVLILSKQDMQGLGSAVTYAKRYCKSAIIGVASDKDDDGNAATGKTTETTDRRSDNRVAKSSPPPPTYPEQFGVEGGYSPDEEPPPDDEFPFDEELGTLPRISLPQGKRVWAIKTKLGVSDDKLRMILKDIAGVAHTKDIPKKHYEAVVTAIEAAGKQKG